MQVVRRLGARDDDQLAVAVLVGDRRVLLEREMRVALVEEDVLEDVVRGGERLVDVAELHRDPLVDVAFVAVVVDARLEGRQRLGGIGDRLQRLVDDVEQVERLGGRQLVARDDQRDGIADEAHLVHAERVLVLAHRQDAVRDRQIGAGQDQQHAGMRRRAGGIDRDDARVRERRAQQLREHHARQDEIVRVLGLTGGLGAAVDPPPRKADDARARHGRRPRGSTGTGAPRRA